MAVNFTMSPPLSDDGAFGQFEQSLFHFPSSIQRLCLIVYELFRRGTGEAMNVVPTGMFDY